MVRQMREIIHIYQTMLLSANAFITDSFPEPGRFLEYHNILLPAYQD